MSCGNTSLRLLARLCAVVLIGLVGTACSLLFSAGEATTDRAPEEGMLIFEGNPNVEGEELYVFRTVAGESYVESYDLGPQPQLLPGRFNLNLRPTAQVKSRGPRELYVMGTGQGDASDTEYVIDLSWPEETSFMDGAVIGPQFPPAVGPSGSGTHSAIIANAFLPGNPMPVTTGNDVFLVQRNGLTIVSVESEPLLQSEEPLTCIDGYGVGSARTELVFFSSSTLHVLDGSVPLENGETLHDIPLETYELPEEVRACKRLGNGGTYITTDGARLSATTIDGVSGAISSLQSEPLPARHEQLIGLELLDMTMNNRFELVLVVADPPTAYLGVDLDPADLGFATPIVAQPLDFVPSTVLRAGASSLSGGETSDRIFIGEANKAPHCFALGISAPALEPALIPCG